jgi:hypothetical protein
MALAELETINAALQARGVRLRLVEQASRLYARGTVPKPDGTRAQQRVPLLLPAVAASLLEAEMRVLTLAREIQLNGRLPEPLPWAIETRESPDSSKQSLTCAGAAAQLEQQFWQDRPRTSAAERTWERIRCELQRLPQEATLSLELLVAVAGTTPAGSRTRLEACKVFKRLAKVAGLEGLEQLDALRGSYEPAERQLPSDEQLIALVEAHRDERWGWATAALVTYGCRPAEVFSLQPQADGTARVLSVKRKAKLPSWRTALALPKVQVEAWQLLEVDRLWTVPTPSDYDSDQARRLVQQWGKWLSHRSPGLQLYAIRHAWAVRTIRVGLNASLAAKCMGHSLAVHHSTYHRWLDESDIAAVAAGL